MTRDIGLAVCRAIGMAEDLHNVGEMCAGFEALLVAYHTVTDDGARLDAALTIAAELCNIADRARALAGAATVLTGELLTALDAELAPVYA